MIQPSSFEPTLGSDCYVIDVDTIGAIRPHEKKSICQILSELPDRRKQLVDIRGGYEVKRGFTYLLPLNETVRMGKKIPSIKSSPKSSFGRLFFNTRMLTDYNPSFDEISASYKSGETLNMWLMLQPRWCNAIIYPGESLNQLRFFTGQKYKLDDKELREEIEKNPILHQKEGDELIPLEHVVLDGLQVHLNLSGKHTNGLVGLRARSNPDPIDIKKINTYDADKYFERITGNKITLKRGEHYLLSSTELLKFPKHLAAELKASSHIGLMGLLHYAGFVDNKFLGDLVLEVTSHELSDIELFDGMPISRLDVFHTGIPHKLYGQSIESNYSGQLGARPAKFFKNF